MTKIDLSAAEESIEWLLANARRLGQARRQLVLMERLVDRIKALVMKKHNDLAVSAQEREAKASEEWLDAITAEADAAGEFEELRTLRDGHQARIEAWRTLESTARQMMKEATHGTQQNYR